MNVISIKFNETSPISNILSIEIFVTSKANSIGITRAYWYEGNLYNVESSANVMKILSHEFNYLSNKLGFSKDLSWYQCFAELDAQLVEWQMAMAWAKVAM